MVTFSYTVWGRVCTVSVPWKEVGNAMVARRLAEKAMENKVLVNKGTKTEWVYVSHAYNRLSPDDKEKIRKFVTAEK